MFTSERLAFREFREEDFALYYSVFSNEQVMRYAWIDRFDCEEELLPLFEEVMKNNMAGEKRKAYEFAVFLQSDNSFIGFANIEIHIRNSSGGCGEIGYFILPEYWGSGYATEIVSKLIEVCFTHIKLHRVHARCNANNLKSEKVMKKAGMKKEGELRKVRFKNGRWDDEKHYGLLAEEWKNFKSPVGEGA